MFVIARVADVVQTLSNQMRQAIAGKKLDHYLAKYCYHPVIALLPSNPQVRLFSAPGLR